MTDLPRPSGPPAGWYDDPLNNGSRRYWDGSIWTDDVHAQAPEQAPPPPATRQEPERPARRPFMSRGGIDWAMVAALFLWPLGIVLGLWLLGTDRERAWKVIAVGVGVAVLVLFLRFAG